MPAWHAVCLIGMSIAAARPAGSSEGMTHPMSGAGPASAVQLVQAGLLWIGAGCRLHPTAVFLPADLVGTVRPIVLGERVVVGAYAVLHGGLSTGAYGYIGHRAILGEPEYSYAVRDHHPGQAPIPFSGKASSSRQARSSTPER
jgi:hypothetical protein